MAMLGQSLLERQRKAGGTQRGRVPSPPGTAAQGPRVQGPSTSASAGGAKPFPPPPGSGMRQQVQPGLGSGSGGGFPRPPGQTIGNTSGQGAFPRPPGAQGPAGPAQYQGMDMRGWEEPRAMVQRPGVGGGGEDPLAGMTSNNRARMEAWRETMAPDEWQQRVDQVQAAGQTPALAGLDDQQKQYYAGRREMLGDEAWQDEVARAREMDARGMGATSPGGIDPAEWRRARAMGPGALAAMRR